MLSLLLALAHAVHEVPAPPLLHGAIPLRSKALIVRGEEVDEGRLIRKERRFLLRLDGEAMLLAGPYDLLQLRCGGRVYVKVREVAHVRGVFLRGTLLLGYLNLPVLAQGEALLLPFSGTLRIVDLNCHRLRLVFWN